MERDWGREVNKGKELGHCREVNGKGSKGKGGSGKKMKGKGSKGEAKQVHRVGQKGKDVMPCCGLAGYDTHRCLVSRIAVYHLSYAGSDWKGSKNI